MAEENENNQGGEGTQEGGAPSTENNGSGQENNNAGEGTGEGGQGGEGFDPDAFSKSPSSNEGQGSPEGQQSQGQSSSGDGQGEGEGSDGEGSDDGESDEFSWDNFEQPNEGEGEGQGDGEGESEGSGQPAQENGQEGEGSTNQNSNDNSGDAEGGDQGSQENSSLNDAYQQIAESLGLEAKNFDEFKETLVSLQKENEELRASGGSTAQSDVTKKLEELIAKPDEELVKLELEKQGFSEEEIQKAVDGYTDSGNLWIEAKKIRGTLQGAITREQNRIAQSEKEAQAKQEAETQKAVQEIVDHVGSLDTMFGFKMTNDEAKLPEVRKNHSEYITSGKFWGEVTESPENIANAAWLWRHRHTILKAMESKGLSKGKQSVLDNIHNPDVPDKSRFSTPGESTEFDAKAFMKQQTSNKS